MYSVQLGNSRFILLIYPFNPESPLTWLLSSHPGNYCSLQWPMGSAAVYCSHALNRWCPHAQIQDQLWSPKKINPAPAAKHEGTTWTWVQASLGPPLFRMSSSLVITSRLCKQTVYLFLNLNLNLSLWEAYPSHRHLKPHDSAVQSFWVVMEPGGEVGKVRDKWKH